MLKIFYRHDMERMCNFHKSLVALMTGIYLVLLFVINPEFVLKGQLKAVKWLPANRMLLAFTLKYTNSWDW